MSEPQIRKASESEVMGIINAVLGELQDPKTCNHRMIDSHDKSGMFEGEIALNTGKCLDCGDIIRSYYRLESEEIAEQEVIDIYYEKRDGFRGYGWYEKDIS